MSSQYDNPKQTASITVYQRALWSLTVGGIVTIFFYSSWLSMARIKVAIAERHQHDAEQQIVKEQRERAEERRSLYERISKAEAAQSAAEKQGREMAAKIGQVSVASYRQVKAPTVPVPALTSEPNGQELEAFVRAHLVHMMQPVETQLADYADVVDFHDKPRASQLMIEADRKQLAQKFPVRVIFKDEIQPRLSADRDVERGWIATAVFDFRWEYRSRTGAVVRGVTRDIWKIIPTAQGLKISSEHSLDPVTGQSKD